MPGTPSWRHAFGLAGDYWQTAMPLGTYVNGREKLDAEWQEPGSVEVHTDPACGPPRLTPAGSDRPVRSPRRPARPGRSCPQRRTVKVLRTASARLPAASVATNATR